MPDMVMTLTSIQICMHLGGWYMYTVQLVVQCTSFCRKRSFYPIQYLFTIYIHGSAVHSLVFSLMHWPNFKYPILVCSVFYTPDF
jgi:hypothetical protein